MIKSFGGKATSEFYATGKSRRFPQAVCRVGLRKLDYLHATTKLDDLKAPPGNRLEQLRGKYIGKYSVRINYQYRVVFKFETGDAYDAEVIDHR